MNDLIMTFLKANEGILSSPCYNRIFLDHWLPDGYKKASGAAMVFRPRGGAGVDNFIIKTKVFEFRAFAESKDSAFEIDEALFSAMKLATYPDSGLQFYPRILTSSDLSRSEGGWYVVTRQFSISMVNC